MDTEEKREETGFAIDNDEEHRDATKDYYKVTMLIRVRGPAAQVLVGVGSIPVGWSDVACVSL